MDEFKLKHLLARKYTVINKDDRLFLNRIRAEHWFVSVDECLDYLYKLIRNQSLNPDNPFFVSYTETPLLAINLVDEALCAIVYELYQQDRRDDQDMLGYFFHKLNDFYVELQNKADNIPVSQTEYHYYHSLIVFFDRLLFICNPADPREEAKQYDLSYTYYILMYTMYHNATPKDAYFGMMEKYYANLLGHYHNHLTPFPNVEH